MLSFSWKSRIIGTQKDGTKEHICIVLRLLFIMIQDILQYITNVATIVSTVSSPQYIGTTRIGIGK